MAIAPISSSAPDASSDVGDAAGLGDPFGGMGAIAANLAVTGGGGLPDEAVSGSIGAAAVDQIFALGGVGLSGIKMALGAVTGDPMAVQASLAPGIQTLAKGEDLFVTPEGTSTLG